MNSPLVSVIVPVYNVKPYLKQCIDSIVRQSYSNLEIILVDDGSTDGCGKLCDELKLTDSRLVVIHQANKGLSAARNTGIQAAHGEYFVFVDSDDWMKPDGIRYLLDLALTHHADLVCGGFERYSDFQQRTLWSTWAERDCVSVYSQEKLIDAIQYVFFHGFTAWANFFHSCLFSDIRFPVGEINEDEAIGVHILSLCRTVVKSNVSVYVYRERADSITTSKFSRIHIAWYYHTKANLEFAQKNYPTLVPYAKSRYISSLSWILNCIAEKERDFSDLTPFLRRELKMQIKQPDWTFMLSRKEQLRILGIVYCYPLYCLAKKIVSKAKNKESYRK